MSPSSEEPTVVETPISSGAEAHGEPSDTTAQTASGFTGTGGSGSTQVPLILRGEEYKRSVALMRLVSITAIAGLFAVWLQTRAAPGALLCTAVMLATLLVTLGLLWRFRDPVNFDPRLVLFQGLMCAASVLSVVYYVGVFSPAIMAGCVGIYFFGLSDSPLARWSIYASVAGGYLVLSLLALLAVLPVERSVLALAAPDLPALIAVALLAQILLALTLWMARRSRQATLGAFERLERAGRQIRKRDALLNEARAEFDLVRAAKLGRWTGQRVGSYDVEEVIGRGAMGEVYRGRQVDTGLAVALKFLHPVVLDEPQHVERFLREAEIGNQLASPHVVEIFSTGVAPDGSPFIVMELLEGSDLASILRDKKVLGMSGCVEMVMQVSVALSKAEEAGIVHRDVKPQNLYRCEQHGSRLWKVLDFGVSKVRQAASNLTQGAAVGTPSYMSPEQARGAPVDHRADVFALAAIAFRCITGRPAFTGPDSMITMYNVLELQPVRPSELARVDPDIDRVLALGLAKDPERRFRSAALFAAAFREAARKRLDPRLRADADELIREQPWGMDLGSR